MGKTFHQEMEERTLVKIIHYKLSRNLSQVEYQKVSRLSKNLTIKNIEAIKKI